MLRHASLRRQLLAGILLPVVAAGVVGATLQYRAALAAADSAYDRTLLASAMAIGEHLAVEGDASQPRVVATLPYSAFETYGADGRSRMYYRILGFGGDPVLGFDDLPAPRPASAGTSPYAALVHFYDDAFRGEPVRMAVLLQPVASQRGHAMATIQVAETLELRRAMAQRLLLQTLAQQAVLVALIAGVVFWVVQRATRPVRELGALLSGRAADDLTPLPAEQTTRELRPLLDATNTLMARLSDLFEHQKRFVRDASHQLRTPLAVLKTQVQSAQRGDVTPQQALQEIGATVDGATELANRMLALAKVEQLRQQRDAGIVDWADAVHTVALDLAPLVVQARLDFEIELVPAPVRAHEWALRELARNLLHNAIRHSPPGARLSVRLCRDARAAALTIADSGPGLSETARRHLFEPFNAAAGGVGLGLTICREIVDTLAGQLQFEPRREGERVCGLDAVVRLPLASPATR